MENELEKITRKQAGEIAAQFIFRYAEELGFEPCDCLYAAKNIYYEFTDKTDFDVYDVIGFTEEELINNFQENY